MHRISRVSHGKPHTSGHGWHIALDCGHTTYMESAPGVGAQVPCDACKRLAECEQEGCGGDAILDRTVN